MEKNTFNDERVKALLGRCIFVRIDTDKQADIAKQMAVEGLPDIRFALPGGRVIKQLRNFRDAESFSLELEELLRKVENK
jgi:thioredoxin-like negative regulator of GroEL